MTAPFNSAAPQPGGISEVRQRLWEAVEAAAAIVADPAVDPNLRLRAVHGVTQSAGAYTRILEASEFEARLAALEAQTGGLL